VKALIYTAPNRVELQTAPDPKPKPDEVVVRIRASGVCGSDVLGFLGKSRKRIPPLILGHEMAGEVAEVGSAVKDLATGARVAVFPLFTCGSCTPCRRGRTSVCPDRKLLGMNLPGGFAEYVVAPRSYLYPIPAAMSFLSASMVEPLATSTNLFDNHIHGPVETVAVFGAGTQGLLALQNAKVAGAKTIFIVDLHEPRLAAAKRVGATHPLNARSGDPVAAILDATAGEGCDVVVDAAGITATRQQAVKVVGRGGTVGLIGLSDATSEFDCLELINREINVQGVYAYPASSFRRALDLIAEGKVDVTSWVREFPLEEGQRLLEKLATQPGDLVKASLTP
jgi:2-desacetyl-2-hydroxyethyl bacteriochlorophyllide A dehydrogenase